MLKCVFLDRDGVLTPDSGGLPKTGTLPLIPGIVQPLSLLDQNEFALVIITNQPQIARGVATESEVDDANQTLIRSIESAGGPTILSAEFCPHHPNADLLEYRIECDCRKPKPGMLHTAAARHGISLPDSFLIGDRMTDVAAGASAGCKTILLNYGKHIDQMIESSVDQDEIPDPDFACGTLAAAVDWILSVPIE